MSEAASRPALLPAARAAGRPQRAPKLCVLSPGPGSGLSLFFAAGGAGEAARGDSWVTKGYLFLWLGFRGCSNGVRRKL